MFTFDDLRLAIYLLGGVKAASLLLGCSDTLVRYWLAGRRLASAEKLWRLHKLITSLNRTLPLGLAYSLKVAAQQAEARRMQWRARRPPDTARVGW